CDLDQLASVRSLEARVLDDPSRRELQSPMMLLVAQVARVPVDDDRPEIFGRRQPPREVLDQERIHLVLLTSVRSPPGGGLSHNRADPYARQGRDRPERLYRDLVSQRLLPIP